MFLLDPAQVRAEVQQVAQLVLSQVHVPLTQCCPSAHCTPPGPQAHAPETHRSARSRSHCTQVAPAVPHDDAEVVVTHTPDWQQPAQFADEHPPAQVPASQLAPPMHAVHAAPPAPQAMALVPGWHMPLWQQPAGQVVESHAAAMQLPASASQLPGVQSMHTAPARPHAVTWSPASHRPLEQHPEGHVAEVQLPTAHAPPSHASPPQLAQVAPPAPHAAAVEPG